MKKVFGFVLIAAVASSFPLVAQDAPNEGLRPVAAEHRVAHRADRALERRVLRRTHRQTDRVSDRRHHRHTDRIRHRHPDRVNDRRRHRRAHASQ